MAADPIRVTVAYALPERQWLWPLELAAGSCVEDAVRGSPLFARFPALAGKTLAVGVFGQACEAERRLRDGDRVEVYRPLQVDPKEARRRRAAGA